MQPETFNALPDCLRLSNGTVDLVVATTFGPRVLAYGLSGGPNLFAEVPDKSTTTSLGTWKTWGGHRLWVAPEAMPGSYAPDDRPLEWEAQGPFGIRLRQRADAAGIEKRMTVMLDASGSGVAVEHEIVNRGEWAIVAAPWAITGVAPGGRTIIPMPVRRTHAESVHPARPLVLWSYTDLTDPRWTLGSALAQLASDPARTGAQKIGAGNERGWCAFVRGEVAFIKNYRHEPGAPYPHFGSSNEMFTAGAYHELETLGPLRRLEPGEGASHVEWWRVVGGIDAAADEMALAAALAEAAGPAF